MIFSLVLDEDDHFYPVSQAKIVKCLMNCTELVEILREKIGDISTMEEKEISFWKCFLMLLCTLSIKNSFGTYQCRRIAPYASLYRECRNPSIPYELKKMYLHGISYIHFQKSD